MHCSLHQEMCLFAGMPHLWISHTASTVSSLQAAGATKQRRREISHSDSKPKVNHWLVPNTYKNQPLSARMLVTSDWRFPRGFAVPQSINKKLGSETIFQGQTKRMVFHTIFDGSFFGWFWGMSLTHLLLGSLIHYSFPSFPSRPCAKIVRITRKFVSKVKKQRKLDAD